MKVIVNEVIQGSGIVGTDEEGRTHSVLLPGVVFDVDQGLGAWLVENHKAQKVVPPLPSKDESTTKDEPAPEPETKNDEAIIPEDLPVIHKKRGRK